MTNEMLMVHCDLKIDCDYDVLRCQMSFWFSVNFTRIPSKTMLLNKVILYHVKPGVCNTRGMRLSFVLRLLGSEMRGSSVSIELQLCIQEKWRRIKCVMR